ncbi:MAG: sporulation protein YabP [Limnochordia bacterium]|jgi:sporulation protein YabP|nr:sporulation protein YabP [Limnochordia bacterium]MDD2629126.1 sporulation protein YabP [Limnochordia bacterium]MDD4517818.1 sporulation protein YabP [Limnochordia bacterium]
MEDKKTQTQVRKKHQFILRNREVLLVEGVTNVDSFDENEITIGTDNGNMLIKGEDLNIKELNLESGNLMVQGLVTTVEYVPDHSASKGKSFLGRLFR